MRAAGVSRGLRSSPHWPGNTAAPWGGSSGRCQRIPSRPGACLPYPPPVSRRTWGHRPGGDRDDGRFRRLQVRRSAPLLDALPAGPAGGQRGEPRQSRLVEVKGNSMEPMVKDGALVIVDASKFGLWDGHIYLMSAGGRGGGGPPGLPGRTGLGGYGSNPACRPRKYDRQWEVHGEVRMALTAFP